MPAIPLDPITAENSALVLIDYQPTMLQGVASGDRARIVNATVAATTAAAILVVPVVLSSIATSRNGDFLPSIAELIPGVPI